jgi:integrase
MRKPKKTDDAYIKLRGDTYHLQLPVPKQVRELYLNQEFITGTLETTNIEKAREERDEAESLCRAIFKSICKAEITATPKRKVKLKDIRNGTDKIYKEIEELANDETAGVSSFSLLARSIVSLRKLENEASKLKDYDKIDKHRANIDAGYDALVELLKEKPDLTLAENIDYGRALNASSGLLTIMTLTEKYLEVNQQFPLKTIEKKLRHVRRLIEFMGSDALASAVTPQVAAKFVNELNQNLKLAVNSKKDIISDLDTIWGYGTRHHHIDDNPWTGRRQDINSTTAGEQKPRYPWKPSQVLSLCDALLDPEVENRKTLIPLLVIGIYSGIRISEIAAFRTEDIELQEGGRIVVDIPRGKTQATVRTIALHPTLKPLIENLISNAEDGYLIHDLASIRGRGVRASGFFSAFKLALFGENSSHYTYHSFRHRFEDMADECEMPEQTKKKLVGHTRMYGAGISINKQTEWLKRMNHGANIESAVARLIDAYKVDYG